MIGDTDKTFLHTLRNVLLFVAFCHLNEATPHERFHCLDAFEACRVTPRASAVPPQSALDEPRRPDTGFHLGSGKGGRLVSHGLSFVMAFVVILIGAFLRSCAEFDVVFVLTRNRCCTKVL